MNNKAFTLVELIVVITILAILSTVAFISFQGYSVNSRDSVRITDMAIIEKGLNIKLSSAELLPIPYNKINISASGTVLNYQGYADYSILGEIGVHGGGIDPIDGSFYTYITNSARNEYQIVGLLENIGTSEIQSQDYGIIEDRYAQLGGDNLGIILNSTDNSMITTNIDILLESDNNFIFLNKYTQTQFTDDNRISLAYPLSSCKSILESGSGNTDGIYKLEYKNKLIQVYCDMTSAGGGWTLFYANNGNADSPIKKSYIQLRDDVIGQDNFLYDLSSYYEENLAGVLDYTIFSDLGANELLASNKDYLKNNGFWIHTIFNSGDTLKWALGDEVLVYGLPSTCINIPNGGTMSIYDDQGNSYENNLQIMNHYGQSIGISHTTFNCNGYNTGVFPHALFYVSYSAADYNRTRSNTIIGGNNWGGDNQYRYFIR